MVRQWAGLAAGALGAALLSGSVAAHVATVQTDAGAVEDVAAGLDHPWGMAFLPDGCLLVTERTGRLRLPGTEGEISAPLAGTPEVFAQGQGGLMDVALDPDFTSSRLVYLAFAQPGEGGAATALGRGRLEEGRSPISR